ncbi:MAG: hypothetical protein QE263_06695 [Vampirovibrionales bacterium]|nr:hypothetical protein [Vampirovibrionales bacterium]
MSGIPPTFSAFKNICVALIGVVIILCFVGSQAFTDNENEQSNRIGLPAARLIALKLHPGEVIYEALEEESEFTQARYFFDIKQAKSLYEVTVNVNTGKTTNTAV